MNRPPQDPALSRDRRLDRARLDAARAGPDDSPFAGLASADLDRPIDGRAADSPPAPPPPHDDWDPVGGRPVPDVPGYALSHLVGRGGQGAVFLGTQVATGSPVAVKVLLGGAYAPSADRRRQDREVEALAVVNHPNVVPVADRGRTADGSFFLVMPFVDGVRLDEAAAKLRLAADHPVPVLRLAARVLGALRAVHAAGLVHRDVKPSNVLVDRWGEPRLLDFGLARRVDRLGDAAPSLTESGRFVGSVAWASPEQAAGLSDRLDARSDVYAAGLLVFHALTGRHPYRTTGTIPDVLTAVVRDPPSRPSRWLPARSPVRARDVDAVLLTSLSKVPGDRYASAGAMLADLERVLAGERPDARPPVRRPVRRWAAAAAVAGAVTAAAVGVPRWGQGGARAVTPFAMPTRVNSVGMRLVRLPAGSTWVGSPTTEPGHTEVERHHLVSVVRPIYIAATEVTRAQYAAVTGGPPPADGDLPAEGVSWEQAVAYCSELERREGRPYRLPTETEWEYACRAGAAGPFAGTGRADDMGWHLGNSGGRPHRVGLRSPNDWGLYDMHGGVEEWCADVFYAGYEPEPWGSGDRGHAVRGGGYGSPADECRTAARRPGKGTEGGHLGFRVVLDAGDR